MEVIKSLFKRTVLIIILISILITFMSTPVSYAALILGEQDFYYLGAANGSYVPGTNFWDWLLDCLGDIADLLLGIMTMGYRMVFVGWTALLEKLLTWALESTTGVSADGSLVESSTDLTGLTDSSNNITVEAIVYNKVAGLNIDFFDLEFDRGISGTGNRLVCKSCNKYVAEYEGEDADKSGCISKAEAEKIKGNAKKIKEKINNGNYDFSQHCSCSCNGCDACAKYVKQLVAEKPIVIKIRELVATWYGIIRFLSMAAMLVILIAIGLKMGLSTIASDKAVYKRMLTDWVVGVIILFLIHYFMIACIHINAVVINTIENSAQAINKAQIQQVLGDEEGDSSDELEIKVYEELRTRAYDARLINGITGMVMYMTMVFFAFKYTLIYLKRYLTILVLTLMGPAVGVAYALQKSLSGKSSTLSTWMKEYIMNVIIQIVHALLYAIFISQAMILSLKSVAGIAFALIMMNYMSKADELFKKIFNFGGSLLGDTENAMQSTVQGLMAAKGMMTAAKPIKNAVKSGANLAKAGVASAVGLGVGTVSGVATAVKDIANASNKSDSSSSDNNSTDGGNNNSENQGEQNGNNTPTSNDSNHLPSAKPKGKKQQRKADDARLKAEGGTKLRQAVETASDRLKKLGPPPKDQKKRAEYEKQKKEAERQHLEAIEKYNRFQKITNPSIAANLGGKLKRSVSLENIFEMDEEKAPKLSSMNGKFGLTRGLKHVGASFVHGAKKGSEFMNGKTTFNPKTMRFENNGTKGLLNFYKNFTPSNFFAFTDEDKKKMKSITGNMGKSLLGMGSLFLGMGMIVAEPSKGMGLMAVGYAGTKKTFGKDLRVSGGKGKYKFSKFGSHSINTIKNSALVRAKQEHAAMVAQGIATDYPSLAEKLKSGEASAITIGELGGELGPLFATKNSPYSQVATAAMIENYGRKGTRFMKNTALGAQMDDFAKHYAKQQRKQMAQFIDEATQMEKTAIEARIEFRKALFENASLSKEEKDKLGKAIDAEQEALKELKAILEEQGYEIDAEGELVEADKEKSKKSNEIEDIYAAILLAAEKELEEYKNSDTTDDSKTIVKKYDVESKDMVSENGGKEITQKEVVLVNKAIDNILAKKSADTLFKKGREGLKTELKKKAAKRNAAVKTATRKLEEIKAKAKENRENKLQQAMLAMIGDESASTPETDKKTSTQDILEQLTQRERDYVTATVSDLLELKELNKETAELNRDKVKGNKKYVKSVKEESATRIEVAILKREILEAESRTDITESQREDAVQRLKSDLKERKRELQQLERNTAITGPVKDIPSFIKSGFKNEDSIVLPKGMPKKKRK